MEGLEEKWECLRLMKEEDKILDLEGEVPEKVKRKGDHSAMGKVWSESGIRRELLSSTMGNVW